MVLRIMHAWYYIVMHGTKLYCIVLNTVMNTAVHGICSDAWCDTVMKGIVLNSIVHGTIYTVMHMVLHSNAWYYIDRNAWCYTILHGIVEYSAVLHRHYAVMVVLCMVL